MITLNAVDYGADDATLDVIVKSAPSEVLDELLKSCGYEVDVLDDAAPELEYEPISKSEILDLIKARKISAGAIKNSKGKTVQKVMKRILCRNSKTGREYFQMRMVNADVASDAKLMVNPLKKFDEHVAMVRRETTAHVTEHAASVADMEATPEGKAALDAINAAIGSGVRSGKLTTRLNYTNIRYCPNPVKGVDADGNPVYYGCLAIAKNPKNGKDQYFYSQQFQEQAEKERLQRAMVLASPAGREWMNDTLENSEFENEDIRSCLKLMYNYGMKSGSEKMSKENQLGDYVTRGATTLTADDVFIERKRVRNPETGERETVDKVYLQFYQQGEKGDKAHQQSIEIKDKALADTLKAKKQEAADGSDPLFSCTRYETLAVCQKLFECNCEDLRSAFGFMKWKEAKNAILGNNPYEPKRTERLNKKTGKRKQLTVKGAEMEIASYIMEQMGVTDKRAVQKFINKDLLKLYQTKPKEKAQKDLSKKGKGGTPKK